MIRNARIPRGLTSVLADEPVDVIIANGRVADLAPRGNLTARGEVLEAGGAWLIPGLWDHHVHVMQWALVAEREDVGVARSAAHAAQIMAAAPALADGRRIGTGFRDALWPDSPTLEILDAATGEVPTYLINADVHSVWLNSAALRREGHHPDTTGVLREESAFEISRRLNDVDQQHGDDHVRRMTQDAAARGVVGLIDFDMAWNEGSWARRLAGGFDSQRVEFGIYPEHLERAVAEGLRSGDRVRGATTDLVRVGPLKVITDGSLGTRTAACSHSYPGDPLNHGLLTVSPERLVELMTTATAAGLSCAVHAIGDVANSHALDAFARTGAWGTIEHAQLVAHADIPRFARLGVAASVQPEHAVDDRDLTDTIWAAQTALPFPLRALADAGADLHFGSDAPVSPLDPWAGIAAAVFRTRGARQAWHPEQEVDVSTALAASMYGGSATRAAIEPGAPADLVLCGDDPVLADEVAMRGMPVLATLLGGRLTHLR
ncbi:amidohydrolase [Microbacterium sp. P01]|uniref:amidohydrolase n=1 Tax=Microbacterium sp. P01 TaxID=3366261 RepID=UPI00366E9A6A